MCVLPQQQPFSYDDLYFVELLGCEAADEAPISMRLRSGNSPYLFVRYHSGFRSRTEQSCFHLLEFKPRVFHLRSEKPDFSTAQLD
ncbi:hypothetical protein CEXT_366681 [Caerostris extrusa]|uniref:Uncharacterized protein n=1 Tax=Caerostris extrusa TaxID=172846 RepID=A0AAV4UNF4_CAEEX|nr:hypothetical protein CEXT_366681 [Caerostris extrusa]